jgi:hypothetical protein
MRVASLLLREGRDRACARLFGVSGDDSGIVTMIALAALAVAVHQKGHDVVTTRGGLRASDTLIGAGILKEVIHAIAGDWSIEDPLIPAIIVGAVIAHHLKPWARVTLHDLRVASHRFLVDFDARYGHHVRPKGSRPIAPPQGNDRPNPAV